MLYQKARDAMEKSKKSNVKTNEKVIDAPKPPIPKKNSNNNQAVLNVISKQDQIRKNFEHRSSFNGNYSKHSNNCQSKEKLRHENNEKISRNKSINKRSDNLERRNTFEPKENKALKPSQITRKEARARIGLGDIPGEKIDVLIKQNKDKLKPSELKIQSQTIEEDSSKQYFEYKSRQNIKPKIEKSNSIENTSNNKVILRKEIINRERHEDVSFHPTMNIVNAKIPNCYLDEIKSSTTEFEDYDHTYLQAYYNNATKHDGREEQKLKTRLSEKQRKTIEINEEVIYSQQNNIEWQNNESRKELVKLQQKEMIRKIKEEKEKARLEELKKKQNLEALNNKIKKKSELYKKK